VLTRGEDVTSLPQLPTGSGFHYSNGRIGIRGKGNELMLEIGRMAPIPCQTD
jgi:membrane-bound inhibitor of C-type lysozyme